MEDIDIVTDQNYINPSRYISGRIIEYDIKSANISVLKEGNYISQEQYDYFNNLPKDKREIEIGLMIKKDNSVYKNIQEGIKEAKLNLINFNRIDLDSIVRVANDAIYINSMSDLKYTKFGDYILFRPKSISNVYINLNKVILFLEFRPDGNINVDVKGIGESMYLHEQYMINAIVTAVVLLERSGIYDAINYVSELCERYVRRELPIGYYREFNSSSKFRLVNMFGNYNTFKNTVLGTDYIKDSDIRYIDINYNYFILRELWSILVEIFEMRS